MIALISSLCRNATSRHMLRCSSQGEPPGGKRLGFSKASLQKKPNEQLSLKPCLSGSLAGFGEMAKVMLAIPASEARLTDSLSEQPPAMWIKRSRRRLSGPDKLRILRWIAPDSLARACQPSGRNRLTTGHSSTLHAERISSSLSVLRHRVSHRRGGGSC